MSEYVRCTVCGEWRDVLEMVDTVPPWVCRDCDYARQS